MTDATTVQRENATDFENTLQRALRNFGFLFPSTEEEVTAFERRCGSTEIIMPFELNEPDFLYAKSTTLRPLKEDYHYENFALAAREGKGTAIPEDIRARMDKDRARSKKQKMK